MIRTRAKQFVSPDLAQINYDLPVSFWASPKLLTLSWDTSDFGHASDPDTPIHAYAVMFDREAVIATLPIEKRGEGARAGSIATNRNFASAREALALLHSALPLMMDVKGAILDYCRTGHIHGAALLMQYSGSSKTGPWHMENSDWEIAPFFWQRCTSREYSHQNWDSGVFEGSSTNSHSREWFRLTGVYFVKSSLTILAPSLLSDNEATEEAVSPEQKLPRLSDSNLEKWWHGKEAIAECLTEDELLTLVRTKFPKNHIARARIRKYTNGRTQGRKPIRRKDTAN